MTHQKLLKSFAVLVLAAWAAASHAMPILTMETSTDKIHGDEILFVDIVVSGLEGDLALGAFDLSIEYNPLVLNFLAIGFGNQLDLPGFGSIAGFAEDPNPNVGAVDFFEVALATVATLQSLQMSEFLLARLSFAGLDDGFSTFNLAMPVLSDEFGNQLSVGPVPTVTVEVGEPGILALFALGLAGLGTPIVRRRQCVAPQHRAVSV